MMKIGSGVVVTGAGLGALLLVAAALYLAGVFEPSSGAPPAPELGASVAESGTPPVEDDAGETRRLLEGLDPISTTGYEPAPALRGPGSREPGEGQGPVLSGLVEDPSGQALGGAVVLLLRDVGPFQTQPQEGAVVSRAETGGDGAFGFRLREGERYVLRASHPDYTTERRYPVDPSSPQTLDQVIRLQAGLSLSGAVRDRSGFALEGAQVLVYDQTVNARDGRGVPERTARADRDGSYLVSHLRPGRKRILVRCEEQATAGRDGLHLTRDLANVDFVLDRGLSISGSVLDRNTSEPLEGVQVTAYPQRFRAPDGGMPAAADRDFEDRPSLFERARGRRDGAARARGRMHQTAPQFLLERVRTDEEGRFEIPGLREGRYRVAAEARGYVSEKGLEVESGALGVNLLLAPSARILGRVVDASTGEPVPEFSIAASPDPRGSMVTPPMRQHFSDPDGRFEYVDVRPGAHYLVMEARGYAGGHSERVPVGMGERVTGVTVPAVRGATLEGRVVDAGGAGVPGARVSLEAEGGAEEDNPFVKLIKTQLRDAGEWTRTDPEGSWVLPHVMPGTYHLRCEHPDFAPARSQTFDCEEGEERRVPDVVLQPGAAIEGTVTDEEGEPDPKATVMIRSEPYTAGGFHKSIATDAQGRFSVTGLRPGQYQVIVTQRQGTFDFMALLGRPQEAPDVHVLTPGQMLELEL